jgi:tRNA pseudouridine65 synthase
MELRKNECRSLQERIRISSTKYVCLEGVKCLNAAKKMQEQLEIIFENDNYLAINKPAGMLVHRTNIAFEEHALIAERILKQQLGFKVFPLHRIDRPTSGIVLFAKSSEAASALQPQFTTDKVKKYYLSIVRGHMDTPHGILDFPLSKKLEGELREARTEFWTLSETEIPFSSSDRYLTSRYSLLKVYPHTGRMHQIRRHMAKARHYVIGDTTHGDNKQNNFFRTHFGSNQMYLHAWKLAFDDPYTGQQTEITANVPAYFLEMLQKLSLDFMPQ